MQSTFFYLCVLLIVTKRCLMLPPSLLSCFLGQLSFTLLNHQYCVSTGNAYDCECLFFDVKQYIIWICTIFVKLLSPSSSSPPPLTDFVSWFPSILLGNNKFTYTFRERCPNPLNKTERKTFGQTVGDIEHFV